MSLRGAFYVKPSGPCPFPGEGTVGGRAMIDGSATDNRSMVDGHPPLLQPARRRNVTLGTGNVSRPRANRSYLAEAWARARLIGRFAARFAYAARFHGRAIRDRG